MDKSFLPEENRTGEFSTVSKGSREKMIFLILQFLFITSCVSGTFVVNVTQTSYQAEENQNITLEWTFSTRTDTSLRSIYTHCELHINDRPSVLFHLNEGVESPESQDPQFSGRVQWDKDVLTEGRLTLHVSRLRTNDSGFYVCNIFVKSCGSNSRRCWLNVTAAAELQTQRPTECPQPESPKLHLVNDIIVGFVVGCLTCVVLYIICGFKCVSSDSTHGRNIHGAQGGNFPPTFENTIFVPPSF